MVESYRNEKELFNLQCWALTCESFFSKDEWKWIFKQLNFKNYYEFIYFFLNFTGNFFYLLRFLFSSFLSKL